MKNNEQHKAYMRRYKMTLDFIARENKRREKEGKPLLLTLHEMLKSVKSEVKKMEEKIEKESTEILNSSGRGAKSKAIVQFSDGFKVEENSKITLHTLTISMWPNIDLKKPDQVEQRTYDYFKQCVIDNFKPNLAGYALSLGITRVKLWEIRGGKKGMPAETLSVIEKAVSALSAQAEGNMQEGKINPIAGIFLMRNNMGYTNEDKGAATEKIEDPLGDTVSFESIQNKYSDFDEE